MSKLKNCPFNLPLSAVDPINIGSGNGSYPAIVADCKGGFVSGVIGHIRFETGPHSGTGRYMSYGLARDMAEYACNAINQFADINKIKADAVQPYKEVLNSLLSINHTHGGSLGSDGSFYYKVSEEVFKKASDLIKLEQGND